LLTTVRSLPRGRGRNRFLWDCPWLVVRAEMRWDRWAFIHDNVAKCKQYYDNRPSWVRAYRIWRLLHQMAGFTQHPDLLKERAYWRQLTKEMDQGDLSDRDASQDTMSHVQMGLTSGELRRIRKLCMSKPQWRWNPRAAEMKERVDVRLGK